MSPPTPQTTRSWAGVSRNLALSDEFMKMPEPIIAPLETMAASNRLSLRMLRLFYPARFRKARSPTLPHPSWARLRPGAPDGFCGTTISP